MEEEIWEQVKKNVLLKEENLSPYATKSAQAIRLKKQEEDIRPPFFRDIDRIIHSLSYTRYTDKTQVYSFKENDHISKRMVHVQLVSKIARTIGRALCLNEDLIEAIALGHDIGHTPLGHLGESLLNEISKKELGEEFAHNIQSVRDCMCLENDGEGLNLTIQVLDGIMCHNGEMLAARYVPVTKEVDEFLAQYQQAYTNLIATKKYAPMTLEGCVVRIADVIGYVGRDIEDAIALGRFKREQLPKKITSVLGNNNKDIVNTIILDIIKHSLNKPYIQLSKEVYEALFALKKFNYRNIYSKACTKEEYLYYQNGMWKLYYHYLEAIEQKQKKNVIYLLFLNYQSKDYLEKTPIKRQVIDFICGMTDEMFIKEVIKNERKMEYV